MDASSLIGNAQNAYAFGLQKQAAAGTAALNAAGARTPKMGTGQVDPQKVHETATQFEAFFVGQMMEHMMSGIEVDPQFGGGTGEDTWRSMLNQEYGKEIAKSGKLGIADNVMKAMLRAQEERTSAAMPQQAPLPAATDAMEVTDSGIAAAAAVIAPIRR
jgi:flagellar protein FlgJ